MKNILAALIFIPFLGTAQSPPDTSLVLEVQMRARSEWRDGYFLTALPGDPGVLSVFQRNRLGVSGGWGRVQFRLQLQDVRSYGQPAGNTQGNVGAAEAWCSLEPSQGTRIAVGRQKIDIDNGRIVGAADWANPGRFLDGIRFESSGDHHSGMIMAAWDATTGTRRLIAHHKRTIADRHVLTLLAFDQKSDNESSAFTSGFTWKSKSGSTGWWATEAYLQQWHGGGLAGMWTLGMGRLGTAGHAWTAGLDLMSEATAEAAAFSPLLGTNHKFYGWMDHFYLGTPTNGLTDINLSHAGPMGERLNWGCRLHEFRTAMFGDLLAREADLWIKGAVSEGISWTIGWSLMDATETHVERQGHLDAAVIPTSASTLQQWGWVMVNFQPSFVLK